jgi:hypothetical protein
MLAQLLMRNGRDSPLPGMQHTADVMLETAGYLRMKRNYDRYKMIELLNLMKCMLVHGGL